MPNLKLTTKTLTLSLVLLATHLQAQQTTNATPASNPTPTPPPVSTPSPAVSPLQGITPSPGQPVYKPPMFGAPQTRVGGGSRGGPDVGSTLEVLAPDAEALTTQAQPSLFWYQSRPAKAQLEVTVIEPNQPVPVLALKATTALSSGIQRLKLSRYNVELKPDVSYRWSVALVVDEENRSSDLIASGVIKRVAVSDDLAAKLKSAGPADQPFVYSSAGIWYDALQSISDLIAANPNEPAYRKQRATLLEQVGLPEAASADQKLADNK